VNYSAMEKSILDRNTIGITREVYSAFDHLCENESFRKEFYKRTLELMDNEFDPDRVQEWVDDYIFGMKGQAVKHNNRFYGRDDVNCYFFKGDGDTFEEQCQSVADFFSARQGSVMWWMNESFGMAQ